MIRRECKHYNKPTCPYRDGDLIVCDVCPHYKEAVKVKEVKPRIKAWLPFSDYEYPCYVMYEGELAVFVPDLDNVPIKVK